MTIENVSLKKEVESPIIKEQQHSSDMTNRSNNKPTLGIALGGGGPRGVAHIGVLKAFEEAGLKPDMIAGTSVGALLGVLYAFDIPLDEIKEYALKLSWWTVTKPTLSRYGLITNSKLRDAIEHFLGKKNIEDASIPVAIVSSDIANGKKVVFREGDVAHAVIASSAIPGIFTPVIDGDKMLVDGGVAENVPVETLAEMNPDVLVGVDLLLSRFPKMPKGIVDVIAAAFYLTQSKLQAQIEHHADILIRPKLNSLMRTDRKALQEAYDEGYHAGQEAIPDINKIIKSQGG